MKILYVSLHPHVNLSEQSGPGTHIREVVSALKELGHDVVVYAAGGSEAQEIKLNSVSKLKRMFRRVIPRFIWESLKEWQLIRHNSKMRSVLNALFDKEKPDFVYERAYYMMTACADVCEQRGVKLILEMNAPYPEEKVKMQGKGCFHFTSNRSERIQITKAAKVIVVSSVLKDYLLAKWKIEESRIVVIPNAVNKSFGKSVEADLFRKKLGINDDDFVYGFVGSIFPYHGVDQLISSFNRLRNHARWGNLKLLIVGNGEILDKLKEQTVELGIERFVLFTNQVPHGEVPSYVACMNATVMPHTNWYCSPVKIFEYAAMKKVVISLDCPPIRDVMEPNIDGVLFDGVSNGLDKAMRMVIDDQLSTEGMAEHFHMKVMKNHTWSSVAELIVSL